MDNKVIVIDPGHGGDDNGAVWGYTKEDNINLVVSFFLRYELEKRGFIVHMTRPVDCFVALHERTHFANIMKADLFISIHCDAFHKTTASGMSVHVHPWASFKSREIALAVSNNFPLFFPNHKNRGVKESNFHVLRNTNMPAVLVECEFLSNPVAREFLKKPENQLELAVAIASAIDRSL